MDEYTALCIAAEEIVARESAQTAIDVINEAFNLYSGGDINVMEMLSQISYAGTLAAGSLMRGWDFLYETRAP